MANPANPTVNKNMELPASGTVGGGAGMAQRLAVAITKANVRRLKVRFDFFMSVLLSVSLRLQLPFTIFGAASVNILPFRVPPCGQNPLCIIIAK
jgi:hypothetical protein